MQYDVAIIGAGVGGLTAAALLSKAGLKVCVLEKEPHPGGYLAGFRRKDFRFDTAIHWLNQYGPGGMLTTIFQLLGDDFPHARPQTLVRRYKGQTFDYLLTNQPDELKREWQNEFPEDAAGIERFFLAAKKLGRAFHNYGHIFRSEETMDFWERLVNKRNLLKFGLPFIPHLRYSGPEGIKKGLNIYFKSPKLHEVFSGDTELLGCLVPIGWAYYQDFQLPPQGGGQRIPEWLSHVIQQQGGELLMRSEVRAITVADGRATGVRYLRKGREESLQARYVLAACDAALLYDKLLPQHIIPQKTKEKLHAAEVYSSSVTISIALDCTPQALGFGQELLHMVNQAAPVGGAVSGNPEHSEIVVLAPSLRDPSLAPEGQGTLVLFMPAYMDFEQQWQTTAGATGDPERGADYKALKEKIAAVVIDRVAAAICPQLRQHILFYDIATPVTHWRYTGNKGGTMMGAKPGRANMQNKVARYGTALPNVFLSGHWAELGGGVPIAAKAGANAALLVLKKEKKEVFKLIAGYMDGKISLAGTRQSPLLTPCPNNWQPRPTPAERKAGQSRNTAI